MNAEPDDGFGLDHLPYGAVRIGDSTVPAVRWHDSVLPLRAALQRVLPEQAEVAEAPLLDDLFAAGPSVWAEVREALQAGLARGSGDREELAGLLVPLARVTPVLPYTVGDYVDFYASEQHATNVGRIFRPDSEPLTPNWKHLPIGYHGRSGTVVASGTEVIRPRGQRKRGEEVVFGPTRRLDIEAEVGFVVGAGSSLGEPVALGDFDRHVFGVQLLNDWSARDLQAWEYVPLGPFLGKSFATSVAAWITPLAALTAARLPPPPRDPALLPYLDDRDEPWHLDLRLEVRLNGAVISRPPFSSMYWSPAQMLAHLTVNGASIRPGDLFASGTVSGPEPGEFGSLLELSWGGRHPLPLPDGSERAFLEDGDVVRITAAAPSTSGGTITLAEVTGRIAPSRGAGD